MFPGPVCIRQFNDRSLMADQICGQHRRIIKPTVITRRDNERSKIPLQKALPPFIQKGVGI